MKAEVLFDDDGEIAVMHVVSGEREREDAKGPHFRFVGGDGRGPVTLDIPVEFHHLTPLRLHAALKVDVTQAKPRLIAKPGEKTPSSSR